LVMRVRERTAQCAREQQTKIGEQLALPPHIFASLRSDLIALNRAFIEMDEECRGGICSNGAAHLVLEFGFAKSLNEINLIFDNVETVRSLITTTPWIDLALLLRIVYQLREIRVAENMEEINRLFRLYDVRFRNYLGEEEIANIMTDFGLKLHQGIKDSVSQLFNEVDIDGDGRITPDDFVDAYNHLKEMMYRKCREEEKAAAQACGFNSCELRDLREAFSMLDEQEEGSLSLANVSMALNMLGHVHHSEEDLQDYDKDNRGRVDFTVFVRIVLDELAMKARRRIGE